MEGPLLPVAQGIRIAAGGRLHSEQRYHRQHMILHNIADRAYLFIKNSAALHPEGFGHGDLHAPDVVAVPDRLQKRVGKAKVQQVLDGFLAEIMIDPKDC